MPIPEPTHLVGVEKACPRCKSTDTKWRYYNNRSKVGETQPRYHCNACDRQFTYAGTFRPTTKPQEPPARRAAKATAKEIAELVAMEEAAVEVARRIARKAEKAATKVEKAECRTARRTATRAAKRAARKSLRLASEDPSDGSTRDKVRHHASPAASSRAEMMASGVMKSSEGAPDSLVCGFVAPIVDGVHVMERAGGGWDEALGLKWSGLELWVGEEAENGPAVSLPEMWEKSVDGVVDGAEINSGLRSLDDLWAEHGGDIDSGLEWLAASCEVGSAEVDTGLASFTNRVAGELVDSGVAGSEVPVSASAGSDEDLELIVSMLSQHDDINSGLEWMSDESEPVDCGLGGFEMWKDCGSAESEAELDWTDLFIIGNEMEGLTL